MLIGESDTLGASDPLLKTGRVQGLVQTSVQFFLLQIFRWKKNKLAFQSALTKSISEGHI